MTKTANFKVCCYPCGEEHISLCRCPCGEEHISLYRCRCGEERLSHREKNARHSTGSKREREREMFFAALAERERETGTLFAAPDRMRERERGGLRYTGRERCRTGRVRERGKNYWQQKSSLRQLETHQASSLNKCHTT